MNNKNDEKKPSAARKLLNKRIKKQDDNVIYIESSEEAKEENAKKKKQRSNTKKIIIIASLIVVLLVVSLVYHILNREYKGYSVEVRMETNYENTANYTQYAGNLLKYTPDGVSYINANGDTVWSAGINMNMPLAVTSGDYVAVADIGGNSVSVFNTEGQISNLMMPYTICDVDVAKQGAFAVVLESDETNYINLYNKKGEIIYEMQTTIDKSGYPLDITISDNGEKLFTSYININGTGVTNSLAAYNFGSVGQNANADRIVGGYSYTDQVVPKVEFVTNNTVVAFGTDRAIIIAMSEKPSITKEIDFEGEARSVFYSSKYIGIIQDVEEDSEHLYKLKVYDLKGKLKFERYLDFEYNYIYSAKKELIISGGADCLIIRSNGKVKYEGALSANIISVVPNGEHLEYVVVYDDMTEIIKLKKDPQNNTVEEESLEE